MGRERLWGGQERGAGHDSQSSNVPIVCRSKCLSASPDVSASDRIGCFVVPSDLTLQDRQRDFSGVLQEGILAHLLTDSVKADMCWSLYRSTSRSRYK